ncbi:MAG TPA: metalloregulator ArsR/SmtB family transcription factor [Streptosporangiaceae bacterium]|jgi:DNA-binding transcriptional ArsR family regulator
MAALDVLLGVLGDPTRREVMQLLSAGPRRAGEIADSAGVSRPVMSRHLRVMLQAGVVADERDPADARLRIFRLRPESVAGLQAWLDQLQAHWDDQLRSFRKHVETGAP